MQKQTNLLNQSQPCRRHLQHQEGGEDLEGHKAPDEYSSKTVCLGTTALATPASFDSSHASGGSACRIFTNILRHAGKHTPKFLLSWSQMKKQHYGDSSTKVCGPLQSCALDAYWELAPEYPPCSPQVTMMNQKQIVSSSSPSTPPSDATQINRNACYKYTI